MCELVFSHACLNENKFVVNNICYSSQPMAKNIRYLGTRICILNRSSGIRSDCISSNCALT